MTEPTFNWKDSLPALDCDVVMKGGITSGVVYPGALTEFAKTYRLRNIGGSSAGAIGAAFGAAAEYGRGRGGFELLETIPGSLGYGFLNDLFRPQPATKALLPIMLAVAGGAKALKAGQKASRGRDTVAALIHGFPLASVIGILPGLLVIALCLFVGWLGIVFGLVGLLVVLVGWAVAMGIRIWNKLTSALPENHFGICTGLSTNEGEGLTNWLSARIDEMAKKTEGGPLTFGDLKTNPTAPKEILAAGRQSIDLRMMSTCLSLSVPFEMPLESGNFFYEPEVWKTFFPADVMAALDTAPALKGGTPYATRMLRDEEKEALEHNKLRRLPAGDFLPIIVATRMSLSFPLLFSAVPLWRIDHEHTAKPGDASRWLFQKLWFTDGGLCENFPLQLFDAALPTRPTFAINLGKFPEGQAVNADQLKNIEYARQNKSLPRTYVDIPSEGIKAVTHYAAAAVNTARNWSDNKRLDLPGYRDRIVRVLQTSAEGGLNLHMQKETITALSGRGQTAARAMVDQFTGMHYKKNTQTGWENHVWVRYRALLGALPPFLGSYANGRATQKVVVPKDPPSYPFPNKATTTFATDLTRAMDAAAAQIGAEDVPAIRELQSEPHPLTRIVRGP
jgi:predicted acylesterase/phospholipase RssA